MEMGDGEPKKKRGGAAEKATSKSQVTEQGAEEADTQDLQAKHLAGASGLACESARAWWAGAFS
jgi:hypothetical protein